MTVPEPTATGETTRIASESQQAEIGKSQCTADHVGDRVQGSNLVEMDGRHVHTVDPRLGFREAGEGRAGHIHYRLRKGGCPHDGRDLVQSSMVARFSGCHGH